MKFIFKTNSKQLDDENKNIDSGININTGNQGSSHQNYIDWVTSKLNATGHHSCVGIRTNQYNDIYAPKRSANLMNDKNQKMSNKTPVAHTPTSNNGAENSPGNGRDNTPKFANNVSNDGSITGSSDKIISTTTLGQSRGSIILDKSSSQSTSHDTLPGINDASSPHGKSGLTHSHSSNDSQRGHNGRSGDIDFNNIDMREINLLKKQHKLDNNKLFGNYHLFVITGRKQAIDGPMSVIWAGNPDMTIRRIGKIYASVNGSCLFSIGSDGNGKDNKYCCGRIADVMIWDGVLSKPDIQNLYGQLFNR